MSSGDSKSKAEAGLAQAGQGITNASQMTPQESSQYSGSFDLGKLLSQIYQYQQGLGQAPQGYMNDSQQFLQGSGEIGQNYYNTVLKGSQDPYYAFESSFQPQLQQAQDSINSYYQKRGLLKSGLAIEGMGRAGVDLSIKEAQARMAAREAELGRTAGFLDYAHGISQGNLANMANLYNNQQQYGLQGKGIQSQGAQSAANYYAYPHSASLGSYYGGQSALQSLPGMLIQAGGTALGGYLGGPMGAAAGGAVAKKATGGV